MRVTLSVNGPDDAGLGEVRDLRRWLQRDPALRGCLQREPAPVPQPGSMGAAGELVPLLLAPGGLTAALAAAVVAWLQNRRGDQTVTITLPDGTEVAVSATKVRGQTAETAGELAQRIAAAIDRPAG
ncbi:effector-associated constant component EACC1, partial [Streptomyces sp. 12297]